MKKEANTIVRIFISLTPCISEEMRQELHHPHCSQVNEILNNISTIYEATLVGDGVGDKSSTADSNTQLPTPARHFNRFIVVLILVSFISVLIAVVGVMCKKSSKELLVLV